MKQKKWVRVLFRQRVFVISILFIQIGFLLYLIDATSLSSRYTGWALNAVSVVVCIYIVNKKEKSAYKLTWIFTIMLFPIFGGLLYILFYFQSNPRKLRRYFAESDLRCQPLFLLPGDSLPFLMENYETCLPQARYLQEYAGFPIYVHTQTEYFPSGETFFKKALEELEKAERYIFLEFFILRQGQMLDPILDILERKAREGLDVRLMYDDLGCFMSLPSDFQHQLERRGIQCTIFNHFKPIFSSLQNNRDHRKIISIDGKVAFTGGMNLADEYINIYPKYGHWKDAAIMIEGEAAWSLTLIFLQMWNSGQKVQDNCGDFYPWRNDPCPVSSDGYVQPYADSPIDTENVGEHVYIQIINNAKEYVYINTPYLVVDDNLLSALTLAAKSGVDVRIITPHRWDKWFVRMVSRSYYRQLIMAGVKVYEYTEGFNHSKTFVSDDKVATVGTTNLDFRSLYLHFECGVWIYKSSAVAKVKEDFLNTVPISKLISLQDCVRGPVSTFIRDVLRIFAPLM
ncbi:cardiolipin synthetase [Treponema primitia ZAS-2]|uniref:Cardiolipin synthase n=1 Tax=Treponema primitia (strain ATCC BAA-887 / DSM 12427 / ZAS-2) TaxID=545694 RepID=F5YP20_TREPZ|nr:cardiolipin synthase [Treponema primitia]AEF85469.1 cardiolipin synthetase [Treponema primitia ZAS-2]